jgi:hypothetical protein
MGPCTCRDDLSRPPITTEVFGWLIGEEAMREAASVERDAGTPALSSALELAPAEELDRILHTHHSEITATTRDAIVNGVAE